MDSKTIDYHAVFVHSTDMISCHDCAGVYLNVSPSCFSILGYEPRDLIGHSAYEFFHPADLAIIRQSHNTIIASDVGTRIIYRIRKKSGDYTWIESTSRCVSNAAGCRIYAYSRDVSNRVAFQILQTKQPVEKRCFIGIFPQYAWQLRRFAGVYQS